MIPNPKVAAILDTAASYIDQYPTVPDAPNAVDEPSMDPPGVRGHDARAAIMHGMDDHDLFDAIEGMSGFPHEAVISEFVADFGDVPRQRADVQRARFEGKANRKVDLSAMARRDRRRDDLLQWARGRLSSEVSALYRRAAAELRTRPADEGFGEQTTIAETDPFTEDRFDELLAMAKAVGLMGGEGEGGGFELPPGF
jgi:hypothetical protein